MLAWFRRKGPAAVFGTFCAMVIGMALTWTCAAFGLFIVTAPTCGGRTVKLAKNRVREIEHAFLEYQIDNGRCPAAIDVLVAEKYLAKQGLVDPWGTRVAYGCYGIDVEVRSAGADKLFNTDDDVTNQR